jgi:hypothetical protein
VAAPTYSRALCQSLGAMLGQQVTIDNRAAIIKAAGVKVE